MTMPKIYPHKFHSTGCNCGKCKADGEEFSGSFDEFASLRDYSKLIRFNPSTNALNTWEVAKFQSQKTGADLESSFMKLNMPRMNILRISDFL